MHWQKKTRLDVRRTKNQGFLLRGSSALLRGSSAYSIAADIYKRPANQIRVKPPTRRKPVQPLKPLKPLKPDFEISGFFVFFLIWKMAKISLFKGPPLWFCARNPDFMISGAKPKGGPFEKWNFGHFSNKEKHEKSGNFRNRDFR